MVQQSHPSLFDAAAHGSSERRPLASQAFTDDFCATLKRREGWTSAAFLAQTLNVDRRVLRQAAQRSGGRVLGHNRGYIATANATMAEIEAVTKRLLSQAAKMRQRVIEIERCRHGHGGDQ